MHRSLRSTAWRLGLLAILLVTSVGCTEWLAAPLAGSLATGYWLGDSTPSARSFATGFWLGYSTATGRATETTTCYRNGEPIDCSAIAGQ